MSTMSIPGGTICYREFGAGVPVLCFAPGALRSEMSFWWSSPRDPAKRPGWMDPTSALSEDFRIIAMDQRNAGNSLGPIEEGDGWDLYARDHLALLDHLGIERCHIIGACIGATFALKLCELAPQRIISAALLQPIGTVPENVAYTERQVRDTWVPAILANNPSLDEKTVHRFAVNLFSADFIHSVTREFVAACAVPMLIMPGNEIAHPAAIAEELLRLSPRAEYLKFWKGDGRDYAAAATRDFLRRQTP